MFFFWVGLRHACVCGDLGGGAVEYVCGDDDGVYIYILFVLHLLLRHKIIARFAWLVGCHVVWLLYLFVGLVVSSVYVYIMHNLKGVELYMCCCFVDCLFFCDFIFIFVLYTLNLDNNKLNLSIHTYTVKGGGEDGFVCVDE